MPDTNIHLLFGITKNGGTDLYLSELLPQKEYRSHKIFIIGHTRLFNYDEVLDIYNLGLAKRKSLLYRFYLTLKAYNTFPPQSNLILSNSILVLIYGLWANLFFYKKKFMKLTWIAQGCEVYTQNSTRSRLLLSLLKMVLTKYNIKIKAANTYLQTWLTNAGLSNVGYIELPSLPIIQNKNNKSNVKRNFFLLFVLRREKCKGTAIAIKILNQIAHIYTKKIVVIDFHGQYQNADWSNKVTYSNFLDKKTLFRILKNTEYLVYPSFFEGYGMLINEAIQEGCMPIIGPDNIFYHQLDVLKAPANSASSYINLIKSVHDQV